MAAASAAVFFLFGITLMLTLNQIARALGGEVAGRDTVKAPGPNHSARDRSLSIKICASAPDGFLVHSHCGDDWRTCRDHVRGRLGLPSWEPGQREDRRTVDPSCIEKWDLAAMDIEANDRQRTEDDLERIARAQALWNEATDPRGTEAERYLAARALHLHDDLCGAVLRYHHNTPWRNEDTGNIDKVPCMLAAFTSFDDGIVVAVHRIRVDLPERWPKTQRKMLGPVQRAAIMLAPAGDELIVAEGLETAMSPREAGITTPCWALGSAGGILKFPVLPGVRKLMLAAEMNKDDTTKPNWANDRSIYCCRLRWHRAGRRTAILKPTVGDDLNATLMAMKATGAAA
jgi:hypothetical protein